jgi:copper(I)-binding protein
MKKQPINFLTICTACLFLFWGCSSDSNTQNKLTSDQLEIIDGWARPGSKGRMSGAYLNIINGTAHADTLKAVNSSIAGKTETHETFEVEEGITEMRPADEIVIPAGQIVKLQPGGLHLMLMNLKKDISPGDSVDVTLEFAIEGIKSLTVPVQVQKP